MKPAGIHHLAICVTDAQAGLEFYRDVLGFNQLPRPDLGPGHWMEAGGQQVHLMQSDEPRPRSDHFAIRVDDLDAAVADLRAHEVKVFTGDPIPGAGRQAFLQDPFGNGIELNQPDN
jgi:catechol 2,3-dioxygenase-like lactoylglutathione lyase family enzyme